jgi:hypothetical protein
MMAGTVARKKHAIGGATISFSVDSNGYQYLVK